MRRRRLIIEPLEARTLLSLAPLGAEFRVNETINLDQRATPGGAVAADDSGAFAVVWSSQQQDGSGDGVYVRAYNADGSPRMADLLVNEYSAGDQTAPAIASDDLGNMTIVWQSAGQDGDGWGIYGRRFADTTLGPIETPPFYGAVLHVGSVGNLGGLVVNRNAEVIDVQGKVIPGLYGTSNTTALLSHGFAYTSGACQAKSMIFGYIAARHAAARK